MLFYLFLFIKFFRLCLQKISKVDSNKSNLEENTSLKPNKKIIRLIVLLMFNTISLMFNTNLLMLNTNFLISLIIFLASIIVFAISKTAYAISITALVFFNKNLVK